MVPRPEWRVNFSRFIMRFRFHTILLMSFLALAAACGGEGSGQPDGDGGTLPPPNAVPVTTDLSAATVRNFKYSGVLPGTDTDGPVRQFSIVTNGTLGTAVVTNAVTGAFTYTPGTDQTGTDTFTFKLSDSVDDSNISTVTVGIRYDVELRRGTVAGDPVVLEVQLPPGTLSPSLMLAPPDVPGEFSCTHELVPPSAFKITCSPLSDTAAGPSVVTVTGSGSTGTITAGEISVSVAGRSSDIGLAFDPDTDLTIIEDMGGMDRTLDLTLSAGLISSGSGPAVIRVASLPDGVTCAFDTASHAASGTATMSCTAASGSDSGTIVVEAVSVCGASILSADDLGTVKEKALAACPVASSDPLAPLLGRTELPVLTEAPELVVQPAPPALNLVRAGGSVDVELSVSTYNSDAFFPALVSVAESPGDVVCTVTDDELATGADTAELSCSAGSEGLAGVIRILVEPASGPQVYSRLPVSVGETGFTLEIDAPELFPLVNSAATDNWASAAVSVSPGSVFTGPAALSVVSTPSGVTCQFAGDGDLDDELDEDQLDCKAADVSSDGDVVIQAVAVGGATASTVTGVVRVPPLLAGLSSAPSLTLPGTVQLSIDPSSDPEVAYPVTVEIVSQPAGALCSINASSSGAIAVPAGTLTLSCNGSTEGVTGIRYTSSNAVPVVDEFTITLELP